MKYQLRERKAVDYKKEKISGDYSYKRGPYNHSDSWISKADLRAKLERAETKIGELLANLTNANHDNDNFRLTITTNETEMSQLNEKLSVGEEKQKSLEEKISNKSAVIMRQKDQSRFLSQKSTNLISKKIPM